MKKAFSSVLAVAILTSGCVAMSSQSLPLGKPLSLVSFNGRSAGDDAFVLELAEGGTYSARYDCASHFGNYTVSASSITLMPGGSTGGPCDRQDISTGQVLNTPTANAARFFTGQTFNYAVSGSSVTFTRGNQWFVLQPEQQ